ncbi:hypothetical protein Goshw_000343 [Gossypium schwendimanii]|uniref:Uncharacterized protein n=1 Tax=Gossypium schwendimanii TaxID=34291 RepID=A0A7J9MYH1_GOSSC|nr:hypothetical protein [Gossypium schwendimanii]
MEALHKLDLRGKNDENRQDCHKEYIDIWDRKMKFLPIREPFFSSDTMDCLEHMPWFRVVDKPYQLSVKGTFIPNILRSHIQFDTDANTEPNADASTITDGDTNVDTNAYINANLDARVNVNISKFCDIV